MKVRYGGWLPQPLAKSKGVRREAGSEGSWRQTPAPRYTNRIRGHAVRASQQYMVKPDAAKGPWGKCGGDMGGRSSFLSGEASRGPGNLATQAERRGWTREESAEGEVPPVLALAGRPERGSEGFLRNDRGQGVESRSPKQGPANGRKR